MLVVAQAAGPGGAGADDEGVANGLAGLARGERGQVAAGGQREGQSRGVVALRHDLGHQAARPLDEAGDRDGDWLGGLQAPPPAPGEEGLVAAPVVALQARPEATHLPGIALRAASSRRAR